MNQSHYYPGQFYSVPWFSLKHIWQPREPSPIERAQHARMVRAFRREEESRAWLDEFWRLNQGNPFT